VHLETSVAFHAMEMDNAARLAESVEVSSEVTDEISVVAAAAVFSVGEHPAGMLLYSSFYDLISRRTSHAENSVSVVTKLDENAANH